MHRTGEGLAHFMQENINKNQIKNYLLLDTNYIG